MIADQERQVCHGATLMTLIGIPFEYRHDPKGRHKIPPSYVRAEEGARPLYGRRDDEDLKRDSGLEIGLALAWDRSCKSFRSWDDRGGCRSRTGVQTGHIPDRLDRGHS